MNVNEMKSYHLGYSHRENHIDCAKRSYGG